MAYLTLKRGSPELAQALERVMAEAGRWEDVAISVSAAIKDVTRPGDKCRAHTPMGMARVVIERAEVLEQPGVTIPPDVQASYDALPDTQGQVEIDRLRAEVDRLRAELDSHTRPQHDQ